MRKHTQLSLPIPTGPQRDKDYSIFRTRIVGQAIRYPWRWEGCGAYSGLKSSKYFATEQAAESHAAKNLLKNQIGGS